MTLALRAQIEVANASAKRRIEEMVLRAAREEKRFIEIDCLPCQNEHVSSLVDWMKSEGLRVEHRKWMAVPTGFGVSVDDDREVEHSKYVIAW